MAVETMTIGADQLPKAASMVAIKMMGNLEGHDRTKTHLLAYLKGEQQAFSADENQEKIEDNIQLVLKKMAIAAEKRGVSKDQAAEALQILLEVDSLEKQFHDESVRIVRANHEDNLNKAINQANVDNLLMELEYNPELRQELAEMLDYIQEHGLRGGLGIKNFQRHFSKATAQGRKMALQIAQKPGLAEQLSDRLR